MGGVQRETKGKRRVSSHVSVCPTWGPRIPIVKRERAVLRFSFSRPAIWVGVNLGFTQTPKGSKGFPI